MKRAIALTLCCLALSACGGSGDGEGERTDALEPQEWNGRAVDAQRAGADPEVTVGPSPSGAGWDLFAIYIVNGSQSATEANVMS
jgi:hypothetical protein